MRIKQAEPAVAAAVAGFVVAAYQYPRGGRQQWCCWIEEVFLPSPPVVAPGAARTASFIGGTLELAIVVVAQVNDQVGMPRGGEPRDGRERPFHRIVARLLDGLFQPTAGVAD